jgi:cytochrome bd-type quinol oxidase subunit 2
MIGCVMRPPEGFWSVAIANGVLGLPAYFISFLFAYGFQDEVGLADHMTFLVLIAIFAVLSGLAGMALPWMPQPRPTAARRAEFGVQMSLALNLAIVAAGSVVSATHKDEGSVSADFSTTTDVLLASVLLVLAAALATAALRVDLRSQPSTHP